MSTGRKVVGAVVGLTLALVAGGGDADAYVQYRSDSGRSFAWMPSCLPLPIVVYPGTFTQMTIDEISLAGTAATAAWSAGANPCTFIEFGVTVASGPSARAGNDARNSIILRDASWCRLDPTGACDPTVPYDPAALALTTVFASSSTGRIADADIEINAYHFQWADIVAHPELTGRHDLQNVLTHETGHVLGLDHSCFLAGTPPVDHTGQPVPACANAPASVQATTMFPSANPGDVAKRTLEPDDQAGVCGIYPAAATPCPPGTDAACTCSPPGTDAGQDAGGSSPDALPADATPADATPADATPTDAGKMSTGGGCGCDAAGRSPQRSWLAFLFLAAASGATIRRRPTRDR